MRGDYGGILLIEVLMYHKESIVKMSAILLVMILSCCGCSQDYEMRKADTHERIVYTDFHELPNSRMLLKLQGREFSNDEIILFVALKGKKEFGRHAPLTIRYEGQEMSISSPDDKTTVEATREFWDAFYSENALFAESH